MRHRSRLQSSSSSTSKVRRQVPGTLRPRQSLITPRRADTWTSQFLQQELRVTDPGSVRNALYFWHNLGVLASLPDDLWRLLEERPKESGDAQPATIHGESACLAA